MRVAPEKTDHAILRVNGDATAISVRFGRWDDWSHRNIFEFANALQNVANLAPFDRKLMFVIDVLIRTTAAAAKIRALRSNAIRRTFLNFNKFGFRELLFLADDLINILLQERSTRERIPV